jgi:hypothetical protein
MKQPNRSPSQRPTNRVALIALLLAATAVPAGAQVIAAVNEQRVDIVAPRLNVRTVCPAVDTDMLTALSRVAMQLRKTAELDVAFALDGRQMGEVVVSGGPQAYRRATRSAVQSLTCDSGSTGPQAVRMTVVFKDL